MKLNFSFGAIDQLWIDGVLPSKLKKQKGHGVKINLSGESDTAFPPTIVPVGDFLFSERPSPLQHAVTLLITYPYSVTPSPAMQDENGWWTIPDSTVFGQIRVPLSAEAIELVNEVDAENYQYELALEGVELSNRTPRK